MDLLRFSTAGSVDDGKSTLIGRLLYDSKGIFEDQLAAIERTSQRRGNHQVDLALLTDGLRAEREQGITIDVAYRYFATPKRKFIIADTPGHVQYTRNMVTGASTADLAIVLIDARLGVLEQSYRHAFIAALLGIPHIVVAVNKMDLVGYDEAVYEDICERFADWAAKLDVHDIQFIPISALHGDNVVQRSLAMPWYQGPSLLYHLEHVYIGSDINLIDVRFPVQWVVRPQSTEHHDFRGYAGQIASGTFRKGDEVIVLPSGKRSRVKSISTFDGELEVASPPLSIIMQLEDDLDISRGDVICRPHNQPEVSSDFEAMVCWMTDEPLRPGSRYAIKHTTRTGQAIIEDMRYRMDVNTLQRDQAASELGLNEIGRVRIRTSTPLLLDEYRLSRATGGFVLIDETTQDTVGAGMVVRTGPEVEVDLDADGPEAEAPPPDPGRRPASGRGSHLTGVIRTASRVGRPYHRPVTDAGPSPSTGSLVCPFVALAEDRDRRADAPDEGNRCYAERAPRRRDLAHQAEYCYTTQFAACSVFLAWAARSAAEPAFVSQAAQRAWGSGVSGPIPAPSATWACRETPPRGSLAVGHWFAGGERHPGERPARGGGPPGEWDPGWRSPGSRDGRADTGERALRSAGSRADGRGAAPLGAARLGVRLRLGGGTLGSRPGRRG